MLTPQNQCLECCVCLQCFAQCTCSFRSNFLVCLLFSVTLPFNPNQSSLCSGSHLLSVDVWFGLRVFAFFARCTVAPKPAPAPPFVVRYALPWLALVCLFVLVRCRSFAAFLLRFFAFDSSVVFFCQGWQHANARIHMGAKSWRSSNAQRRSTHESTKKTRSVGSGQLLVWFVHSFKTKV